MLEILAQISYCHTSTKDCKGYLQLHNLTAFGWSISNSYRIPTRAVCNNFSTARVGI